jgi:gamma-glutamylcyclotransferase
LVKYFAYGSNMNPERMRGRGINFGARRRATLEGYQLVFNVFKAHDSPIGYANIVSQDDGARVEGVLYEMPFADFAKLDRFEDGYDRGAVTVTVDHEGAVEAAAYIGHRTALSLAPTREYLRHLLIGSSLLSPDYQRWLKTIKTLD